MRQLDLDLWEMNWLVAAPAHSTNLISFHFPLPNGGSDEIQLLTGMGAPRECIEWKRNGVKWNFFGMKTFPAEGLVACSSFLSHQSTQGAAGWLKRRKESGPAHQASSSKFNKSIQEIKIILIYWLMLNCWTACLGRIALQSLINSQSIFPFGREDWWSWFDWLGCGCRQHSYSIYHSIQKLKVFSFHEHATAILTSNYCYNTF